MIITFITFGNRKTASTRYRILQFIPLLKKDGFQCRVVLYNALSGNFKFIKKLFFLLKSIIACIGTDVIFIQKILFLPFLLKIFQALSRNIIFDFDDAIWLHDPLEKKSSTKRSAATKKLSQVLRLASQVIVGNEYLKDYALTYNPNSTIIPSVIDLAKYTPRRFRNDKKFCLGWIGTSQNFLYLSTLENVFKILHQKFGNRIYLKIISDKPFVSKSGLEVKNVMWNEQNEIEEMQKFNIGLMPLPDTPWTKGKCAFKAIQYMSLEIVPIVGPVGTNKLVIQENKTGYFAKNDKEWIENISLLYKNANLRRTVGKNAKAFVENNYSLKAIYPRFKKVLGQMTINHS